MKTKAKVKRERLSIDVSPEEHRKIKAYSAIYGKTIREYTLEIIRERLSQEEERLQLLGITTNVGEVLKELWDNEKDAEYDKI